MAFYRLKPSENKLPKFKTYIKKSFYEMGFCFCRKCKKDKKRIIYMYNVGLDGLHTDNLFLCSTCFQKLGGPTKKVIDSKVAY